MNPINFNNEINIGRLSTQNLNVNTIYRLPLGETQYSIIEMMDSETRAGTFRNLQEDFERTYQNGVTYNTFVNLTWMIQIIFLEQEEAMCRNFIYKVRNFIRFAQNTTNEPFFMDPRLTLTGGLNLIVSLNSIDWVIHRIIGGEYINIKTQLLKIYNKYL